MGLTIHYSGSFNSDASLSEMIEEVKDIAEIYNWKYTIYEDQFPDGCFGKTTYDQNIYGISFTPHNSEPVFLCFLSNGKMSSPMHLHFWGNSDDQVEREYLYMLFTKTQYAGIEIHKVIIHLLKYVSKKYLKNFTVNDEGKYWESGDEKLLEEIFKRYTDFMDDFSSALENYPMREGETFEIYFERLLKLIHQKNKK